MLFNSKLVSLSLGLGLCLNTSLWSAEEDVKENEDEMQPPYAEIVIPDITRTKQRFDESVYAKLWNDPAADRLRLLFNTQIQKQFERVKARDGLDIPLVLKNLDYAGARLINIDSNSPDMSEYHAYVVFKEEGAEQLMQLPALDDAPFLEVDGADEAFISENGVATLTRFGNTLVFADPDNISVPAKINGIESDVEINFSSKQFFGAMLDMMYSRAPQEPKIKKEDLKKLISQYDQYTHTITLKSGGIYENILFIGPEKAGVQTIDKSTIERMPNNALLAAAIGINGKDLWHEHLRKLIDIAAQDNPNQTGDDIVTELNNMLNLFGATASIDQIFEGFNGTCFMTITPSAPFPAVTIGIPRSQNLDDFIGAMLLSQFNIVKPPEGKIEMITLGPGAPPLQLGLGKDYWVVSTDPVLTQNWLAGKTGGWHESDSGKAAMEKAGDNAFVVGALDTKRVVVIAQSLLGLAAMGARGDDQKNIQSILMMLQKLQTLAEPGYMVGRQDNKDFEYEIYSLVGSGPLLLAPGATFAGVRRQERRARRMAEREQQMIEERKKELERKPDTVDDL